MNIDVDEMRVDIFVRLVIVFVLIWVMVRWIIICLVKDLFKKIVMRI